MTWPAIDSRDYVVALELRSTGDCPPDFALPATLSGFDTGLFLPRDDPDWLGRSSYPPRILLLKGNALHVVTHPSAGEAPACCAMERISWVESGHMLLKGWLRFNGSGFDYTLRYNTRGFPAVFRFLRAFRDKWLRGAPCGTPEVDRGAALDLKFANALAQELDPQETIAAQFFQPARGVKSPRWLVPRWLVPSGRRMAGDLLALTGRRLLWITDRERGTYSPYGTIVSYAPLGAVRTVALASVRDGDAIRVELDTGPPWVVPIRTDCQQAADDFAARIASMARTSLPYRCAAERI